MAPGTQRRQTVLTPLRIALGAVVVAVLAGVAIVVLVGQPTTRHRAPPRPSPRLFAASSVWNRPLPADAPTDPRSTALVAHLADEAAREQRAGIGPWINASESSTPIYTVPRDQPLVPVTLTDGNASWRRSLARAFARVPLPADARPARGPDHELTVWQPSTDRLWEFWQLRRAPGGGFQAAWGGAIDGVSTSPGYYTGRSWPGSTPRWGATATSLPAAAGTIRLSELRRGVIPHALAIALPDARKGRWAFPAQRSDGQSQDPDVLPEGAHLRLDPQLDVDALHLNPVARAIAVAAQRYGIIVRDVTHHAIGFYGEDPAAVSASGDHPYQALYRGSMPTQLLAHFPWSRLQVLRMHLCTQPYRACVAG